MRGPPGARRLRRRSAPLPAHPAESSAPPRVRDDSPSRSTPGGPPEK
ncbi:hypothetical protein SHJG_8503 [Streptomyces hygroscopicus subsp. jinggangensis 5008]|nr:hypothetical protein SHJG_8503 [Streptomyces hygroscopicus subsp. jinggangensis 5008]AGF67925.1 hypothetical protein SHJGH_8263 [Streptomyces hygroscopicus subsp. jinggangensis TL01]